MNNIIWFIIGFALYMLISVLIIVIGHVLDCKYGNPYKKDPSTTEPDDLLVMLGLVWPIGIPLIILAWLFGKNIYKKGKKDDVNDKSR